MKRTLYIVPMLLCIWMCYGFTLSPNQWLRDLGLVTERTVPRYANIQFWDPIREEERGIRVFFYTTLPDKQNRLVDERLHNQMAQYLSLICGEVITLDFFTNPAQKRIVETTILSLLDEWKLNGGIEPDNFFGPLPFLNVDMIIFMERTAYETVWRQYDKMLVMGFNLAALELDLGEPVFAERFLTEIPWTGQSVSHVQVEKKALLEAADAMGRQFTEVAEMIKQLRLREMQAEFVRIRAEEREAEQRARDEQRQAVAALRNAERALRQGQASPALLDELQVRVDALAPLARARNLTPEQSEFRRQLSEDIEVLLGQVDSVSQPETLESFIDRESAIGREPIPPWLFGEVDREAAPEAAEAADATRPIEAPLTPMDWERSVPAREGLQAAPSLDIPVDDPFDRRWLLPRN